VKYAPPCIELGCAKDMLEKTKSLFGSNILFSIIFKKEKINYSNTQKIRNFFIDCKYERQYNYSTMFRNIEKRKYSSRIKNDMQTND
jgi:hypothetical protein